MATFRPGTQIAYVPTHAEDNLTHPDVEFGFVTSERGDNHFCRYWRKGHLGELRTTSCSELTPTYLLVEYESVPQAVVEKVVEELSLWIIPKP
jgi:hypothetical protein